MTGNNKMTLNKASMNQALEYWLKSQFAETVNPTVTKVSEDNAPYGTTFTVEFDTPIPEEAA